MNKEGEFILEPPFLDAPIKDMTKKIIQDIKISDCTPILNSEFWKEELKNRNFENNIKFS